jgi:hypothetical protein
MLGESAKEQSDCAGIKEVSGLKLSTTSNYK